jgi:hypothetical protein
MTDRQGNPIKLYYSERMIYREAGMAYDYIDSTDRERTLAGHLLNVLERLGRLREQRESREEKLNELTRLSEELEGGYQ